MYEKQHPKTKQPEDHRSEDCRRSKSNHWPNPLRLRPPLGDVRTNVSGAM